VQGTEVWDVTYLDPSVLCISPMLAVQPSPERQVPSEDDSS